MRKAPAAPQVVAQKVWESLNLNAETVTGVFMKRLDQLTDGWYIAKSEKGEALVLCHDDSPHNGRTCRDQEIPLGKPEFRIILLACQLEQALRNFDKETT